MQIIDNPWRGRQSPLVEAPFPSVAATEVQALLGRCPVAQATPLVSAPALAERAGVAEVWVKDERGRMGLGSFKALGAAYVIAQEAVRSGKEPLESALQGRCFVTASAGNHGLSVAAGARIFGARAVIYLAETVPEGFAARLEAKGAEVVREGADYEASMAAAQRAAAAKGWTLLSDSSWPGYTDLPHRLMEGYLALAAELEAQMAKAPSHVLLQAGVGGLAGAVAVYLRKVWGNGPRIIVIEPAAAPALYASIEAGEVAQVQGPISSMGRLDCKAASMIALNGLARDADAFALIDDAVAEAAAPVLEANGLASTPSGAAGLAALLDGGLRLDADARVLCILSEAP